MLALVGYIEYARQLAFEKNTYSIVRFTDDIINMSIVF